MKKINLKEEAYNKLIKEISYRKVQDASDESDDIFNEMDMAFRDFYDTVKYNSKIATNPYVQKIKKYADAIDDIFNQKSYQRRNFNTELNKFDYKKAYENPEEEDYDNLDLRYLQQKYPNDNK